MALIDALLDKVSDPSLRRALREQVDSLLSKQSYGLVFQQHAPEKVELPNYKVRRGCKVRIRSEDDALYLVESVKGETATVESFNEERERWDVPLDDLIVVREFGDPIYPGLRSTGKVEKGGEKPAHLVINAENFHALETLLYTHEDKVDLIYIDPPYNTRDKDWKYNNDYVDSTDIYRHSKWLAMMQRRLELAGRLLKSENSVLIVTIDEKEYLRLGLLLEQLFPNAEMTMVTSSINNAGASRQGTFGRAAEYLYFLRFGASQVSALTLGEEWNPVGRKSKHDLLWNPLIRTGTDVLRSDSPSQFFPVFIRNDDGRSRFDSVGDTFLGTDITSVKAPKGCVAVWPIRQNGDEGRWQASPAYLRELIQAGHARLGRWRGAKTTIYYLKRGERQKVADGLFEVIGRRTDGSIETDSTQYAARFIPTDVWRIKSHDAGHHGSSILRALVPGRPFPFPKSLYAVEDTLRFFLDDKPNAVILDFFAGSGTTAHAVMRLNRQDGGRRQCILVTNNEVSSEEQSGLRSRGLEPGEPEWEARGICDYITKPRIRAAITGITPAGDAIKGDYKFVDDFPMSEGFEENAEFFDLTYEDPDLVSLGRKFEAVAPLLWLKAGGVGGRISEQVATWALPGDAVYGILFDIDEWRAFVDAVVERGASIDHVFIVTDSQAAFQQIVSELPARVRATQLYNDYLTTFEINTRGRT